MQRLLWILLLTVLVSSCKDQTNPATPVKSDAPQAETSDTGFVACGDERPEMCTHIYQPVCGKIRENHCEGEVCPRWETYGNACSACADRSVVGYLAGPCD